MTTTHSAAVAVLQVRDASVWHEGFSDEQAKKALGKRRVPGEIVRAAHRGMLMYSYDTRPQLLDEHVFHQAPQQAVNLPHLLPSIDVQRLYTTPLSRPRRRFRRLSPWRHSCLVRREMRRKRNGVSSGKSGSKRSELPSGVRRATIAGSSS